MLTEHLAAAGIAVLSYDKRGTGRSAGAWASATVGELADDAAAAAFGAHPRVVPGTVGVLGPSEGGWVGLRLCAGYRVARYLIVNSCPAVSFLDCELYALTSGGAVRRAAAELWQQLADAVRAGRGCQDGQRILATCEHQAWYEAVRAAGFSLDTATWSQLRAWVDYDPDGDLAQLTTPTLVIFGGTDPLVPVWQSTARYEQTAAQAGRHQKITVFPRADHRLRAGADLAPGYLDTLSTWCQAHSSTR